MREVIIGLQFSALIPILVIFYFKPTLNLFFKLLFASILLSVLFDIIGTASAIIYKDNIIIYIVYYLCNLILVTIMWKSLKFYPDKARKFVKALGSVFFILMVTAGLSFSFNKESFYIISSLNVVIGVIFPIHFFYQRIAHSLYTSPLDDPYFFAATGYILFSLSTIIILIGQIKFAGETFMIYAWVFRQLLYLIYNLIIGYAFYILYISQTKVK